MVLRDYQSATLHRIFKWFREHSEGNPCVVLPTGAGKSIVISALCEKILNIDPQRKILIIAHQKELVEQDYSKLQVKSGIFSASIGRHDTKQNVIVCNIQSIYKTPELFGKVDLIIIDEAHLINHEEKGMYRKFIESLTTVNNRLRCVGFTATPYRLKHGMITDKPALFSEPLIDVISIKELQDKGYLCKLTSKATKTKIDTSNVSLVAGEYNLKELEETANQPLTNEGAIQEIIKRSSGRNHWLIFCCGISHAEKINQLLNDNNITSAIVSSHTGKTERPKILQDFRDGKITALTNANLLTTGFDFPGIDLIAMIRPTMSPGLYAQMVGRGLRISPEKENCLVLDFAGNIEKHGIVTDIQVPHKRRKRQCIAPTKICPKCDELVHLSAKVCPSCGYEFPQADKTFKLSDFDISGGAVRHTMDVISWTWKKAVSKKGNPMFIVTYYPKNLAKVPITEYLVIAEWNRRLHELYPQKEKTPTRIIYHKDGKYYKIDKVEFVA